MGKWMDAEQWVIKFCGLQIMMKRHRKIPVTAWVITSTSTFQQIMVSAWTVLGKNLHFKDDRSGFTFH